MSDWKKVEAGTTPTWNEGNQPQVSGVYKEMKVNVGPNESNLYILKQDNGEDIAVWGSTVIDSRMRDIPLGNLVKIVSLGEEKSEKSGKTYKNYEVYTKPVE